MEDKTWLDIETFSDVNLKKTNVYRYVQSEAFQILMMGWSHGEPEVPVLTDLDEVLDAVRTDLRAGRLMVAHNATFERVCFSAAFGMRPGKYLDPEQWHDTQAVAAEYGYPQKLETLAKALGGEQKDGAGTRLINLFSKPNRKGERTLPEDKPEEWMDFMAYCGQDVVTLMDVDRQLGDFPTEVERQVYFADQRINDTGIRIDTDMARRAVHAAEDNRMEQELRVMSLTGIANPGSQPQFLSWCQTNISGKIKNLQADTVQRLIDHPRIQPQHREILELRKELALVASKKFTSALRSVNEDDRIRGTLGFFGAHTGRWSGRGTQVQNLPREAFLDADGEWDGAAEEAAIFDLKMGLGASALDLKKLVRPMFVGPFTVVDYAAIEARVVAWLAGEQWALDAFAAGRDIYVETANRMGGLTRSQGKVAVLALGYAGGVNSLRVMGAEGDDEALQSMVDQWRRANRQITRLWASLGEAVADASPAPRPVGPRLAVSRSGSTVRLHLPSGRAIHYHGMKWERYRVVDPKTKRSKIKEGWRYDDPKRPGQRIGTYGGRLCENATQAVARDLLAEALVRLQAQGYTVVGHVHDEVLVEGEHPVQEVADVMCALPDWADGLPVDGAGFQTARYRKD